MMKTRSTHHPVPNTNGFLSACLQFSRKKRGPGYFEELALFLSKKTGMKYIFVSYAEKPDFSRMKAAVFYAGGQFVEDHAYIPGGGVGQVSLKDCYFYPKGSDKMFHSEEELQLLGIKSYIGLPLFSDRREPIGLLAIMATTIVDNPTEIYAGLNILSRPVTTELKKFLKKQAAAPFTA